jgi:hypothetical protein
VVPCIDILAVQQLCELGGVTNSGRGEKVVIDVRLWHPEKPNEYQSSISIGCIVPSSPDGCGTQERSPQEPRTR